VKLVIFVRSYPRVALRPCDVLTKAQEKELSRCGCMREGRGGGRGGREGREGGGGEGEK
jgi:hypothetical protein